MSFLSGKTHPAFFWYKKKSWNKIFFGFWGILKNARLNKEHDYFVFIWLVFIELYNFYEWIVYKILIFQVCWLFHFDDLFHVRWHRFQRWKDRKHFTLRVEVVKHDWGKISCTLLKNWLCVASYSWQRAGHHEKRLANNHQFSLIFHNIYIYIYT